MRNSLCLLFVFLVNVQIGYLTPFPTEKTRNPVLLISLDGFRADKFDSFLIENPDSNFAKFIKDGLKAKYMKPAFPSLTFPNHWTIVTGLYPGFNGIVGNTVYDPEQDIKMNLLSGPSKTDVVWWNTTDPIWLTAREQGLKTGCSFWPGSEVWTRNPDVWLPFNKGFSYKSRIDETINWFSKLNLDFATLYFDEPDGMGHKYGPNSQNYKDMMKTMDGEIGYLMDGLKKAELYDKINIIILSDHGMAEVPSIDNVIPLENYINTLKVDENKSQYYLISHIYPTSQDMTQELYYNLSKIPNMKVYLKEEIPEDFHYSNSNRIAPIVCLADEGYTISKTRPSTLSKPGFHGYNNSIEAMRTIFIARGPDFKANKHVDAFENVNVYPLMCSLLKIDCHKSNGSINTFDNLLNGVPKLTVGLGYKMTFIVLGFIFKMFM